MARQKNEGSSLEELKSAIRSKELGRLYVFHGEESFLLDHYLESVKKILLDELTEAFNYHRFHEERFTVESFGDAVENFPMMADHTLVQVDDVDLFKMAESDRDRMVSLLQDIPEHCTVVFTYLTVQWKPDKRMKKLWDAISKCGTIVEFAKQEPRDLIPWISRHFAARGKRITNDLCAYLMDITGGTMTALSGEIDKICAYSGAEHICRADIDAVTEPVMDAVVFQMTDLMGQGKYGSALQKLQQLLKMQQEPIAILGAVGNHFRRIGTARTLIDHGRPVGELMSLCAMGSYPAQKTMDTARRFSTAFCRKAMELVLETDYKMKTSFDDQDRLLELLVVRLGQEAGIG